MRKVLKSKILFVAVVFAGMTIIAGCGLNSDSVEFGEDDELIVDAQSALEGS